MIAALNTAPRAFPRMEDVGLTAQTFGQRLRELRDKAGLSQAELAAKAGLHRFGIAKLERGEREPAWNTVQKIAHALGLTCTAFEGTVPEGNGDPPAGPKGRPKKPAPEEAPADPPAKKGKGKKGK